MCVLLGLARHLEDLTCVHSFGFGYLLLIPVSFCLLEEG